MTETRFSHRALRHAIGHVADTLAAASVPAHQTVVLVPFAQLLPLARQAWAALGRPGFSPRFETTQSWAARLSPFEPQSLDLAFEPARDLLVAQQLLLSARAPGQLSPAALLEAATEVARRVAAVPPAERSAWLASRRAALPLSTDSLFAPEATLARLSLEWAAGSRQATDVLWDAMASGGVRRLWALQGLQPDPLVQAWQDRWPQCVTVMPLLPSVTESHARTPGQPGVQSAPCQRLQLHEATDSEDEAQRAAACVIRHLQAGRMPVALAATDRVVSRRVQALLAERGVRVRDETGWRLSTTRAAATLLRTLELWAPEPASDAVIDWLKHVARQTSPVLSPGQVARVEALARQIGQARWPRLAQALLAGSASPDQQERPNRHALVQPLVQQVEQWRHAGQTRRPLGAWLIGLRDLLQASGLWPGLKADAAGAQLLDALRIPAAEGESPLDDLSGLPAATRPLGWSAFAAWVRAVLEQASFRPPAPEQPHVVLLPLAQLAGRDVAAAVLPGCDEVHLPQVPPLSGLWTRAQREALGLPTQAALQQAQRLAWADALDTPAVDVLWRRKDALGSPVSPSGFVERLLLQGAVRCDDPRAVRTLATQPRSGAAAVAPQRLPQRLSASAYADLRACPYRFFALRMLRLREDEEIDTAVDKRDFGSWLHRVLHDFHERLAGSVRAEGDESLAQWLDEAAEQARRAMGLSEAEFLPFSAAWPDLRDHYLAWWTQQQAVGVHYVEGEADRERMLSYTGSLGEALVVLQGRIDRVDRIDQVTSAAQAPGSAVQAVRLVDYKTESIDRTQQRVRDPMEDTQMAFYAALVGEPPAGHTLQGGYLQLGEREAPRWVEQPQLVDARDALLQGVQHDLSAIAAGVALSAMGSGSACTHCAAHGLCRKEHWA